MSVKQLSDIHIEEMSNEFEGMYCNHVKEMVRLAGEINERFEID